MADGDNGERHAMNGTRLLKRELDVKHSYFLNGPVNRLIAERHATIGAKLAEKEQDIKYEASLTSIFPTESKMDPTIAQLLSESNANLNLFHLTEELGQSACGGKKEAVTRLLDLHYLTRETVKLQEEMSMRGASYDLISNTKSKFSSLSAVNELLLGARRDTETRSKMLASYFAMIATEQRELVHHGLISLATTMNLPWDALLLSRSLYGSSDELTGKLLAILKKSMEKDGLIRILTITNSIDDHRMEEVADSIMKGVTNKSPPMELIIAYRCLAIELAGLNESLSPVDRDVKKDELAAEMLSYYVSLVSWGHVREARALMPDLCKRAPPEDVRDSICKIVLTCHIDLVEELMKRAQGPFTALAAKWQDDIHSDFSEMKELRKDELRSRKRLHLYIVKVAKELMKPLQDQPNLSVKQQYTFLAADLLPEMLLWAMSAAPSHKGGHSEPLLLYLPARPLEITVNDDALVSRDDSIGRRSRTVSIGSSTGRAAAPAASAASAATTNSRENSKKSDNEKKREERDFPKEEKSEKRDSRRGSEGGQGQRDLPAASGQRTYERQDGPTMQPRRDEQQRHDGKQVQQRQHLPMTGIQQERDQQTSEEYRSSRQQQSYSREDRRSLGGGGGGGVPQQKGFGPTVVQNDAWARGQKPAGGMPEDVRKSMGISSMHPNPPSSTGGGHTTFTRSGVDASSPYLSTHDVPLPGMVLFPGAAGSPRLSPFANAPMNSGNFVVPPPNLFRAAASAAASSAESLQQTTASPSLSEADSYRQQQAAARGALAVQQPHPLDQLNPEEANMIRARALQTFKWEHRARCDAASHLPLDHPERLAADRAWLQHLDTTFAAALTPVPVPSPQPTPLLASAAAAAAGGPLAHGGPISRNWVPDPAQLAKQAALQRPPHSPKPPRTPGEVSSDEVKKRFEQSLTASTSSGQNSPTSSDTASSAAPLSAAPQQQQLQPSRPAMGVNAANDRARRSAEHRNAVAVDEEVQQELQPEAAKSEESVQQLQPPQGDSVYQSIMAAGAATAFDGKCTPEPAEVHKLFAGQEGRSLPPALVAEQAAEAAVAAAAAAAAESTPATAVPTHHQNAISSESASDYSMLTRITEVSQETLSSFENDTAAPAPVEDPLEDGVFEEPPLQTPLEIDVVTTKGQLTPTEDDLCSKKEEKREEASPTTSDTAGSSHSSSTLSGHQSGTESAEMVTVVPSTARIMGGGGSEGSEVSAEERSEGHVQTPPVENNHPVAPVEMHAEIAASLEEISARLQQQQQQPMAATAAVSPPFATTAAPVYGLLPVQPGFEPAAATTPYPNPAAAAPDAPEQAMINQATLQAERELEPEVTLLKELITTDLVTKCGVAYTFTPPSQVESHESPAVTGQDLTAGKVEEASSDLAMTEENYLSAFGDPATDFVQQLPPAADLTAPHVETKVDEVPEKAPTETLPVVVAAVVEAAPAAAESVSIADVAENAGARRVEASEMGDAYSEVGSSVASTAVAHPFPASSSITDCSTASPSPLALSLPSSALTTPDYAAAQEPGVGGNGGGGQMAMPVIHAAPLPIEVPQSSAAAAASHTMRSESEREADPQRQQQTALYELQEKKRDVIQKHLEEMQKIEQEMVMITQQQPQTPSPLPATTPLSVRDLVPPQLQQPQAPPPLPATTPLSIHELVQQAEPPAAPTVMTNTVPPPQPTAIPVYRDPFDNVPSVQPQMQQPVQQMQQQHGGQGDAVFPAPQRHGSGSSQSSQHQQQPQQQPRQNSFGRGGGHDYGHGGQNKRRGDGNRQWNDRGHNDQRGVRGRGGQQSGGGGRGGGGGGMMQKGGGGGGRPAGFGGEARVEVDEKETAAFGCYKPVEANPQPTSGGGFQAVYGSQDVRRK